MNIKSWDITKILLVVILALIVGNMVKDFFSKENPELERLRKQVIAQSKLTKVAEGRYEKLVDDYATSKSLGEDLKSSNEELYKSLKTTNNRLVALTKTVLKLKNKEDTIELPKPIDEVIKDSDTLTFFYPDKTSPLISHSLSFFDNNKVRDSWNFKPISLDLAITETEEGIFKADIGTNKWVQIDSLSVKTIPFRTTRSKIGWTYGVGVWKGQNDGGVDLYGGARFDKFNLLIRLQPAKDFQLGAVLLFNP